LLSVHLGFCDGKSKKHILMSSPEAEVQAAPYITIGTHHYAYIKIIATTSPVDGPAQASQGPPG
jgi:hypothetical protein